ncbi:MAG: hypothetical protein ACI81W_003310 [Saprospiraceae bacterium]|jgi:hypothetical protein
MSIQMKIIFYLFIIGALAIACQPNEIANTKQATNLETPGNQNVHGVDGYDSTSVFHVAEFPSFIVDTLTDEMGMPKSNVAMDMFGYKIFVTDAAVQCLRIKKEDYENYQIPATAFDACGGWWAGGGEYFYIIKNDDVKYYTVMQAKVSEEQEGPIYDYQSIMNFTKGNK